MNYYKQATRENWLFQTPKGTANVHDLWHLPLESEKVMSLNSVAIALHNSLSSATGVSFVKSKSPADTLTLNKLELVKDIIATKEAEALAAQTAKATESHNSKIDQLIAAKVEQELSTMSIEQLQALKK
jgi:thiamine biosynthesis protein ThiC